MTGAHAVVHQEAIGPARLTSPSDSTREHTPGGRQPDAGTTSLVSLQRLAGNRAVEDYLGAQSRLESDQARTAGDRAVQRQMKPSTPSILSTITHALAKVATSQNGFVALMHETSDIITWTQDYYRFINGTYKGCYDIHKVVVAQAKEEERQAEVYQELAQGIVLATAAVLIGPEAAEALEGWSKLKPVIDLLPQRLKVPAGLLVDTGKEVAKSGRNAEKESGEGPPTSEQLEIASLKAVIRLFELKTDLDDSGMRFFSDAVSVISRLVDRASSPSGLSADESADADAAVAAIVKQADALMTGLEQPMGQLRALRDRLWKVVPTWNRCEQDIWIAYFKARNTAGNYIGWSPGVMAEHMVKILLVGEGSEAGGRLGVPEYINIVSLSNPVYPAVREPGREDEASQMSTADKLVGLDERINEAARALKPYWREVLLVDTIGAASGAGMP